MPAITQGNPVAAVRSFNRFYTNIIGLLREGLLRTPYTLTEARVIFELGQRDATEAVELRRMLDIDPGYLTRILARFETDGLVTRRRSETDGRRLIVQLTRKGRAAFATLDRRSAKEVGELLSSVGSRDQQRLVGAMGAIEEILGRPTEPRPYRLRSPGRGELGWVVHRHGALYAEEYGWDERFEALVARIVADYMEHHDPKRERAWIAELDGAPVGSIFCTRKDHNLAQLRLLLVEPRARGLGIGAELVDECVGFARMAGYEEIMLWTNDVLEHARPIYEHAGFELVEEEPHDLFGPEVVGQTWSRRL